MKLQFAPYPKLRLHPREWSLRIQLAVALGLLVIATLAITDYLVITYETAISQQELEERSHHTVLLTSEILGGAIASQDFERLKLFVDETILHDENVVFVEIVKANMAGTILLQTGDAQMADLPQHVTFQDNIQFEGEQLGTIYITWKTDFIDQVVSDRITRINRVLFVMFGLMICAMVLLGHILILKPLGGIDHRIQHLVQGDISAIQNLKQLDIGSSREWSEVANTTNLLQDALIERQAREEALREARDEALEMSRLKSHFLTNLSHEFRTPLNGIQGLTELLITTDLDEEQSEYTQLISESGGKLEQILTDVLDFSSIERGEVSLEIEWFAIVPMLKAALAPVYSSAEEKGVGFSFRYSDIEPDEQLCSDSHRLSQIVTHLVDNAFKFTPAGDVMVELGREEGMDGIKIKVSDTGIGIPKEEQSRIFDSFYQVDGSLIRAAEGNGLGLSIVSGLVTQLNGTIQVESDLGVGTTFTVKIPSKPQLANIQAPSAVDAEPEKTASVL